MLKYYVILLLLILIGPSRAQYETHNEDAYEYEDDEDSLSMFPTRKVTKSNQDLINKDEFCKETCHNSREHLCADWIDTRDKTDSKYHYTADGVFSYYKNFVYKFLNLIQADKLMESADDPVNIKQVVRISVYDLEKLILFTKYETKIWNSSIQEVTDILKKIIIDTESYKPDSKLVVFMGRIEQYSGLSVKSISICIAIVVALIFAIVGTLKSGMLHNMTPRKFIALVLLTGFVLTAINNYFYLSQKKELLRRAHLASYVPSECFETNKNVDNSKGLFNALFNYFKTSPTSKICLDYSEAIMIDSFIKVNFMEVISYTCIQAIRPVFISTGEFLNEFYVGLSKDLNMIQSAILSVFISVIGSCLFIFLSIIFFCHEISIMHLFTIKKNRDRPIDENEVRAKLTSEIIGQLAVELPSELKLLKKIDKPSIDDLRYSVKLYVKSKESEIRADKDAELKCMLEDIVKQQSTIQKTTEIKSLGYVAFAESDSHESIGKQNDMGKKDLDVIRNTVDSAGTDNGTTASRVFMKQTSEIKSLGNYVQNTEPAPNGQSAITACNNDTSEEKVRNMKKLLNNLDFEDIDYVLDDEYLNW